LKVTRVRFERMTETALRRIPRPFRDLIVNLEISVKARPGMEAGSWRGSRTLLGMYRGLRRADMVSPYCGAHTPARIMLYQTNIETLCRNEAHLARQIRTTLRHELAHHFGFSDRDLEEKWPEGA